MSTKKLFYGQFNWEGQIFKIWKHAPNERRAFHLMIREVAYRVGYSIYVARLYFSGQRDNYRIEQKEAREDHHGRKNN